MEERMTALGGAWRPGFDRWALQVARCLGLPGGTMSSPGSGFQGKLGSSPTQTQLVLACWGGSLAWRDHK